MDFRRAALDYTMRDYSKDLDGLAWWMMPSVIWFDMMIIALQAAIVAHNYIHQGDSGE